MSKTRKDQSANKPGRRTPPKSRQRALSVRAVRRSEPDLRKLSRAIIELALAQAEADAEKARADATKNRTDASSVVDTDSAAGRHD